jgi:hypothetical protein
LSRLYSARFFRQGVARCLANKVSGRMTSREHELVVLIDYASAFVGNGKVAGCDSEFQPLIFKRVAKT